MSNMSYCRFQNTLKDLHACYDALCEDTKLSKEEWEAARKLLTLCAKMQEEFSEGIDAYDSYEAYAKAFN
jgi:hypothetical protein